MTTRTVVLSDLRAEIGPKRVIDLEKIARRDAVEESHDLKHALNSKRLQLVKSSVVKKQTVVQRERVKIIEKVIHREKEDNQKLIEMLRQVVREEMPKQVESAVQEQKSPNMDGIADTIKSQIESMRSDIRKQIGSFSPVSESKLGPAIDPEKLAEITEKPVQRITESLETSHMNKNAKKFVITNQKKNLDDMANELEDI